MADTVGAGDTFNAGVLAGLDRAGALSRAELANADPEVLRAALDLGAGARPSPSSRPAPTRPGRASWAEAVLRALIQRVTSASVVVGGETWARSVPGC